MTNDGQTIDSAVNESEEEKKNYPAAPKLYLAKRLEMLIPAPPSRQSILQNHRSLFDDSILFFVATGTILLIASSPEIRLILRNPIIVLEGGTGFVEMTLVATQLLLAAFAIRSVARIGLEALALFQDLREQGIAVALMQKSSELNLQKTNERPPSFYELQSELGRIERYNLEENGIFLNPKKISSFLAQNFGEATLPPSCRAMAELFLAELPEGLDSKQFIEVINFVFLDEKDKESAKKSEVLAQMTDEHWKELEVFSGYMKNESCFDWKELGSVSPKSHYQFCQFATLVAIFDLVLRRESMLIGLDLEKERSETAIIQQNLKHVDPSVLIEAFMSFREEYLKQLPLAERAVLELCGLEKILIGFLGDGKVSFEDISTKSEAKLERQRGISAEEILERREEANKKLLAAPENKEFQESKMNENVPASWVEVNKEKTALLSERSCGLEFGL